MKTRNYIFLITAALIAALGLAAAVAAAPDEQPQRPRCEHCGMFTDSSSTAVSASINLDGLPGEHVYDCLDCLHAQLAEWGERAELLRLQVLDYSTFGGEAPQMLDGMTAWFLFDTVELAGSMPPYIAAFATREAALAAHGELGGTLIHSATAVLERLDVGSTDNAGRDTELGEDDPAAVAGDAYVCPCTGDCCSDVRSDSPGECPKCGMELVKQSEK